MGAGASFTAAIQASVDTPELVTPSDLMSPVSPHRDLALGWV